jgi:hypothetical protein
VFKELKDEYKDDEEIGRIFELKDPSKYSSLTCRETFFKIYKSERLVVL